MPKEKDFIKRGVFAYFALRILQKICPLFLNQRFLNQEHANLKGSYILCANHVTYIDGLFISQLLSKEKLAHFSALGGADLLTDYGFLGKLIAHIGAIIPVDRKGNPLRGILKAKKFLEKENHILLIHPEGTRTNSGKLEYLHQGAPLLSFKCQVPLVPIYIHGAYQIWPKHQKFPSFFQKAFQKRKLLLDVGPAFYPQNFSDADELFQTMTQWFKEKEDFYSKDEKKADT